MDLLDIAISSITFLSLKEKLALKTNLDSLDKLAVLSIEDISKITGRPHTRCLWNPVQTVRLAEKSALLAESYGIEALTFTDDAYPLLLKHAFDAPYMIFYRGNIECIYKNCISVVGTRRVNAEGAKTAFDFSKEACLSGFTVVSGLAEGIDSFAHKGALASECSLCTAAVLPCGIDSVVPSSNKSLAREILKKSGCLLSEYLPGTFAEKWRFVQRNRIIAALSCSTFVVQAPSGSGALITADFALDYNRELLFSSCCNLQQKEDFLLKAKAKKKLKSPLEYIKEGAAVIDNFSDFIQVMKDPPGMHVCCKKSQMELFDT